MNYENQGYMNPLGGANLAAQAQQGLNSGIARSQYSPDAPKAQPQVSEWLEKLSKATEHLEEVTSRLAAKVAPISRSEGQTCGSEKMPPEGPVVPVVVPLRSATQRLEGLAMRIREITNLIEL